MILFITILILFIRQFLCYYFIGFQSEKVEKQSLYKNYCQGRHLGYIHNLAEPLNEAGSIYLYILIIELLPIFYENKMKNSNY